MDDKIKFLKDHIDKKASEKTNETQHVVGGGVSISVSHMAAEGSTVNTAHTIINNNHSSSDFRFDDSALQQGRKALDRRNIGDVVDVKFMTYKEYQNYVSEIWDGVERRINRYNWTAWDWESDHFSERRKKSRRQDDVEEAGKNETLVYYSFLGFGFIYIIGSYIKIILDLLTK